MADTPRMCYFAAVVENRTVFLKSIENSWAACFGSHSREVQALGRDGELAWDRLDSYDKLSIYSARRPVSIWFAKATRSATMQIARQCIITEMIMIRSTLTDRGQTTIPAEVRAALGLKPRQQLTYELCDGGVFVRPETESLMDLAGSIKSAVPAGSKEQERRTSREARVKRLQ